MGCVGRHARRLQSPLGFSLRAASCASPSSAIMGAFCGSAGDVGCFRGMQSGASRGSPSLLLERRSGFSASCPRSFSSASIALASRRFPRGVQAAITELGSEFHQQQDQKDLDSSAVKLFESPWHVYPSSSVLMSSHGSREQIRCSSHSSMLWKRSSSSAAASVNLGDSQTIEQLWVEYLADPSQWWDNRIHKRNPRSPDFKHKVTGTALWIDGWNTPAWVNFKLVDQVRLQSDAAYITRYPQGTAPGNRQPEGKNGKFNSPSMSARALGQIVQGGGGRRHVQSSITLGEAIEDLKNRLQQGIIIDSYMYVEILKRCLKQKDLMAVKQVHDCVVKSRMEQKTYLVNNLLSAYIRCGGLQEARCVFDALVKKTCISWNIMMGGYAQCNNAKDAMGLFQQMCEEGVQLNEVTYLNIFKACASPSALIWGKKVHAYIRDGGLESDVRVGTALLKMYAKCGCINEARHIFDKLTNRDVFSWNVMIGAYIDSGGVEDAYRLFLQMNREGFKPDAITYLSILNACASTGSLDLVKMVHGHALKAGLESDVRVGSALVHMYAKSGSIGDARSVFDRMKERNVVTWTTMIGGLSQHGCGREAYELFLEMQRDGCTPDGTTFISILSACASAGALDWVIEVHKHALKAGVESDLRVGNALVHMYAKSGIHVNMYARLVFDSMEERNVITWTAMIGGLAQHGFGQEALEVFRQMTEDGVKPDGKTFVAVLSACSHSGLVDEGRSQYLAMTRDYGIEPDVLHCTCMVDLLGRAGRLEEAKLFIGSMAVEPNQATWGALLGACRTYGNVELGELAAKEVLRLVPDDASAYVLLSNIYARAGKWDMVSSVRSIMHMRGIRKEPGRSWIEINNRTHEFVAGDLSHAERKEIYEKKDLVFERIKAEGYIPDTQLVLKNIDEEDKELDICSHSEKLAIVYGLMHTSPGKPIRVKKNLRVCTDCHTATKFISKVEGREIIVRDAYRFHYFKDGVCSCGDYW